MWPDLKWLLFFFFFKVFCEDKLLELSMLTNLIALPTGKKLVNKVFHHYVTEKNTHYYIIFPLFHFNLSLTLNSQLEKKNKNKKKDSCLIS